MKRSFRLQRFEIDEEQVGNEGRDGSFLETRYPIVPIVHNSKLGDPRRLVRLRKPSKKTDTYHPVISERYFGSSPLFLPSPLARSLLSFHLANVPY